MAVSITKEQLIEKLEHRIAVTTRYPDLEEAQLDAVILKIALEALTAEPVAWRYHTKDKRVSGNWMLTDDEQRTKESASFESEPLYAAAPAPVVPDGYALVPIEPTESMIVDGFESEPDEDFSEPDEWKAYKAMSGCQQAARRAKLCWAAMVAAAQRE